MRQIAAGNFVHPGSSESVDLAGHELSILARREQTGGRVSVFEARNKECVADRHIHHESVKVVYVLEGTYIWNIGDEEHEVGPGAALIVPQHVAHHFSVGPAGARQLFIFAPAGMEHFFIEEARLIQEGRDDEVALAELYSRYELEAVPHPANR